MPSFPHLPPSLKEVLAARKPIHNVNKEHNDELSAMNRVAVVITDKVGTFGFFLIIATWTVFWLGWNFLGPKSLQFDPPMAFVFYLFISNVLQILLMPLLMVGQNLQGAHSEKRAQSDFEINVQAEKEVEVILHHLEHQNAILYALVEKMGLDVKEVLEKAHGNEAK